MKGILLTIIVLIAGGFTTAVFPHPGNETPQYDAIILFPSAPNPFSDKCLIRTYLPVNDPFSSIRILKADSTLVKEIPLGNETGISATPVNSSDLQDGSYLYQLFYQGEVRSTLGFTVKH